ncbi:MAG TPA: molybdopterin-binding protein [Anaerolineae bacterium]|nr:molybdopterin-binding protein [Anaerolineae bacterium]
MKFGPVPLAQAAGKTLGHNIAGLDGRRVLRKGKPLTPDDIELLERLGRMSVYVAEMAAEDMSEDAAARRVAEVVMGPGLRLSGPASGRVNLSATALGVLRVDVDRLARINQYEGVTLATLTSHTAVQARQIVATVKIIPFAVPETLIGEVEKIAAEGDPILKVEELAEQPISLILTGSLSIREKLALDFAPLVERVTTLGSHVAYIEYISLEDESGEVKLAESLARQRSTGARLIMLAGETAIMDRYDIVPRAVERAGGCIESVGAPVDPGNLLMLAYLDDVPLLGAPGCARSRKINVIDWVLPRLLVGDRLTRADIVSLGHGGLLEDVPERPMPRNLLS